ncbi:restriction endonuclease subunit S [Xanthomonas oryzae pv. oryzicola]|uniref:restriction endonuclease subunit S n=1 Tax=Xanthomonas oryzae TaxID=347 RepID=UPI001E3CB290|nr:restriction endonuclease subunit S [Xanthomonas oryzae]
MGDIFDIVGGGTPPAADAGNFSNAGTAHAWLTPADLSGYKKKLISHGARDLSAKGMAASSAKLMPAGSVLFTSRAPIGYVAIADGEISTNQGFKSFILPDDFDPSYVYYYLKSIRNLAESRGTGTTFKELSGAATKELPFVIAPLAEQKRIAQKLDALLAQVDTLKARIDAIPALLKRFRRSILNSACSGELTADWRDTQRIEVEEENGSAIELLKKAQAMKIAWSKKENKHNEAKRVGKRAHSYTRNRHSEPLPQQWAWANLEDVALMVVDCHNKTAPYADTGIPLIRTPNVRDGRLIYQDLKFITEETYKKWAKRCPPESGDIIFTREAPMGEAAIVPKGMKVCLGQRTMLIRPLESCCAPEYLLISLLDPAFKDRASTYAVGTGVKHYRVGDVSELLLALPPLSEQTEIVRRVEQLFAYADQLEAKVAAAQQRIDALTQSLLAKAFRGELVPQDPSDEPASVLLDRIRAQRAATPKPKRGRKAATS